MIETLLRGWGFSSAPPQLDMQKFKYFWKHIQTYKVFVIADFRFTTSPSSLHASPYKSFLMCRRRQLHNNYFKGALCRFGKYILILKNNTISYFFTLFICGGPCHLSSFKTAFWDLIFQWEELLYSVTEKQHIITSLILLILQFWVWISYPKLSFPILLVHYQKNDCHCPTAAHTHVCTKTHTQNYTFEHTNTSRCRYPLHTYTGCTRSHIFTTTPACTETSEQSSCVC